MTMHTNPLGNPTDYPTRYDANLLYAISRMENRRRLGLDTDKLSFRGYDVWRAYEISWLDAYGKPVVAVGEVIVPASSPNMVESKSFKLYLNSLNQERYDSMQRVRGLIAQDISHVTKSTVLVQLYALSEFAELQCTLPQGDSLDELAIEVDVYQPTSALLTVNKHVFIEELVFSNLFRSNCPVTSQPDWGTVSIQYKGARIERESLLRYLISFRNHNGFHEDCTEQIYTELVRHAAPEQLSVAINFLRRGGLEINPVRTSSPCSIEFPASRFLRQ